MTTHLLQYDVCFIDIIYMYILIYEADAIRSTIVQSVIRVITCIRSFHQYPAISSRVVRLDNIRWAATTPATNGKNYLKYIHL